MNWWLLSSFVTMAGLGYLVGFQHGSDQAQLALDLPDLRGASHQWFFDGTEHVDPAKEANAQATRLASNTTTLAAEYARAGKDWETELHQRAKEKKLMVELGLTEEPRPAAQEEDEEVDRDVEEQQTA